MKRNLCIIFAVILVAGLMAMQSFRVEAIAMPSPTLPPPPPPPTATPTSIPPAPGIPDPYAVPSAAGAALTDSIVIITNLPGTSLLDSGKYSPVGFKAGDAQFGGSGLTVSSLVYPNTAKVCFPFSRYRYQWEGVVSQWNGSKWVPLTTTFPTDADGNVNWACASGVNNGTYTLIIWYTGPAEPPVSPTQILG